jgi:hypothetical protein
MSKCVLVARLLFEANLLNRKDAAREAFDRAASLTDDPALRDYLFQRSANAYAFQQCKKLDSIWSLAYERSWPARTIRFEITSFSRLGCAL